jgi:hypothetical protein
VFAEIREHPAQILVAQQTSPHPRHPFHLQPPIARIYKSHTAAFSNMDGGVPQPSFLGKSRQD